MPTNALFCDACGSKDLTYDEKLHLYRCESCLVLNELTVDATLCALDDDKMRRAIENARIANTQTKTPTTFSEPQKTQSELAYRLQYIYAIVYSIAISVVFVNGGDTPLYAIILTGVYLFLNATVQDLNVTQSPSKELSFTDIVFLVALAIGAFLVGLTIKFSIFYGVGNILIGLFAGILASSLGTIFNRTSSLYR